LRTAATSRQAKSGIIDDYSRIVFVITTLFTQEKASSRRGVDSHFREFCGVRVRDRKKKKESSVQFVWHFALFFSLALLHRLFDIRHYMLSSAIFFPEGTGGEGFVDEDSESSLSAPLLLRSNDGTIAEQEDDTELAVPAAAGTVTGSNNINNGNNMAAYHTVGGTGGAGGRSSHRQLPLLLRRCVQWKSAADALPTAFHVVVTNGKICALAVLGCYLIFISLWFPFWLLSFLLTEWGVYGLVVGTIFFLGRCLIRLIAFPGASQKVTKEIEAEFAKYSVRMIVSASTALSELASAVIHALEAAVVAASGAGNIKSASNSSIHSSNIPGLWRRAKMVRDRVLGVYLEVLLYLYQQAPTSCNSNQDAFINKFGNNRLQGDVGTLGNLTVRITETSVEVDDFPKQQHMSHTCLIRASLFQCCLLLFSLDGSQKGWS
jgi:hypothetical protein